MSDASLTVVQPVTRVVTVSSPVNQVSVTEDAAEVVVTRAAGSQLVVEVPVQKLTLSGVGTAGPEGPAGPAGPAGAAGPAGEQGPAGVPARFEHIQAIPTDTWVIPHALGHLPASIIVYDSTGEEVEGDVLSVSVSSATVHFSGAFSGTAVAA